MEQLEPKPYSKDNNYLIYPDGRVWSNKTNKFLSQFEVKGYFQVGLFINGKRIKYYVHRLVAETFIPNPDNLPQVNHIDENTKNNNYSNLEWVTSKQNANHGTRNAKISEAHLGNKHPLARKVEMLDPKTKEVLKTFDTITGACDYLKKSNGQSTIARVCRGKQKTAYGYLWRYCE